LIAAEEAELAANGSIKAGASNGASTPKKKRKNKKKAHKK